MNRSATPGPNARREPKPIAPSSPAPCVRGCRSMSLAIADLPTGRPLRHRPALDDRAGGRWHWYARYEGGPRHSLGEALRQWVGTADDDRPRPAGPRPGRRPGRRLRSRPAGRRAGRARAARRSASTPPASRSRLARALGATACAGRSSSRCPARAAGTRVLLADGNIGIGGDPVALLTRCRDLIAPAGRVLVELDPPGHRVAVATGCGSSTARSGAAGSTGRTSGSTPSTGRPPPPGSRSTRPGSGTGARSPPWPPAGAPCVRLGPGVLTVRDPGHRGCGVHRLARRRRPAGDAGHEVRVLDALLPAVHPAGTVPDLPAGVELLDGDVRDAAMVDRALSGVDAVCHQAAMVGLGRRRPGHARVRRHQRAWAPRCCWPAWRGPTSAGWCWPARWSSTARAATSAPCDGVVPAAPRRRADLDDGRFEPPCPHVRPAARLGDGDRGRRRSTRATPTRRPSSDQEHLSRRPGPSSTGGGAVALRYHNVYGPHMPRDTPYAGVAAIFRSALEGGRAPRVFEDGGQQRDFVHVTDVAAGQPRGADRRAAGRGAARLQRRLGPARTPWATWPGRWPTRSAARTREVTGEYRIGDVRHVVASPERGRRRSSASGRRCRSPTACAPSPPIPLRPAP